MIRLLVALQEVAVLHATVNDKRLLLEWMSQHE